MMIGLDLSFIDKRVSKKTKAQVKKMLVTTFQKTPPVYSESDRVVSYSQISKFNRCPKLWELTSYRKVAKLEPSIHLIFGTAMHNTIQAWIQMCYDTTIAQAMAENWSVYLLDALKTEYQKEYEKTGVHFSTKEEMSEFYNDGVGILQYVLKHRTEIFNSKYIELVGVELPLYVTLLEEKPNIKLLSYLDIVLFDRRDSSFIILDFKTSTRGWKDYDKKDRMKTGQLLLYKKYFAKQYNIDESKIHVQFVILKRKLIEESLYAQKRIQKFTPPTGPRIEKQLLGIAEDFINKAFNADGSYINKEHPAVGGKDYSNCKWCQFENDEMHCPKSKRICI